MPVIIQQGENKILAAPGVVVGISEDQDRKTSEAQFKHFEERGDHVTSSLLEKIRKKLGYKTEKEFIDEIAEALEDQDHEVTH